MKKKKNTVVVKVTEDDSYKTELKDKITEEFGTDSEMELTENIALGFAEALKKLKHKNFDIIVKN